MQDDEPHRNTGEDPHSQQHISKSFVVRDRMNVPKDNEGLEDQFMNEKFIQFQTGCEDERDPTACYSLGEWYAVTSQNYDKAR